MCQCTPGDWYYEGPKKGGRVLADDERKTIIHEPSCSPFHEQAIADARLIATAKKLYTTLHTMHSVFSGERMNLAQERANDATKALLDELADVSI